MPARSRNHCCRGKPMSVTYCKCVFVALGFQHAKRMHRIILWHTYVWPVWLYRIFPTLSQKRHDYPKKKLPNIRFFNYLYKLCLKHFSFQEEFSEILLKMYIGLREKCPLFLSEFKGNWIFSTDVRKILKYQNSWKSNQWGSSCSMRTDRHEEANSHLNHFI